MDVELAEKGGEADDEGVGVDGRRETIDGDEGGGDVVETVGFQRDDGEDERAVASPRRRRRRNKFVERILHPGRREVRAELGDDGIGFVGVGHRVRRLVVGSYVRQRERLARRGLD